MTKILVLGGTGFIGPAAVRHFAQAGHAVAIFHRGQREVELPSSVQHVHGERQSLLSFAAEFRRISPEVVVDMRPMTQEDARGLVSAMLGRLHLVLLRARTLIAPSGSTEI